MTADISINVLGDFTIWDKGERTLLLPTRKSRALLAYLALHPGKRFSRNQLAALLWGDQSEGQARQSLRQALSSIRQVIGSSAIMTEADLIYCHSNSITSDVSQFESLSRIETLDAAERASQLYLGSLLDGHEFGQPLFDEWLDSERERLKEMARRNLGSILIGRCNNENLNQAISAASSLAKLDPFDEAVHRSLMRLYVRQGRIPRAIGHFQKFSIFLRSELGVAPDDETTALYNELCADRTARGQLNTLADYAFVLEQHVHCVVVTDRASHIVGWNKAAESQFGYSKDFMFGQTPTLVYAPKRDQSLADNVFKLACQQGQWSSRVRLLSKDGLASYQTRTVAPLYDRNGTLIGAFGMGVPVS